MTTQQIAEFFSLLAILEPDSVTCQIATRLAAAGTATNEETDIMVIKEIKEHAGEIVRDLASVNHAALAHKKSLIARYMASTVTPS